MSLSNIHHETKNVAFSVFKIRFARNSVDTRAARDSRTSPIVPFKILSLYVIPKNVQNIRVFKILKQQNPHQN
jgi:hypothetical protein